jgi:hypothetical protein
MMTKAEKYIVASMMESIRIDLQLAAQGRLDAESLAESINARMASVADNLKLETR